MEREGAGWRGRGQGGEGGGRVEREGAGWRGRGQGGEGGGRVEREGAGCFEERKGEKEEKNRTKKESTVQVGQESTITKYNFCCVFFLLLFLFWPETPTGRCDQVGPSRIQRCRPIKLSLR